MKRLDVLFIEPNSALKSYQDLAIKYSAVETPTWSLLLANSVRSKGFSAKILDANAERLDPISVAERVNLLAPRLVLFVVYGQNPNSGTTNMSGAVEEANKIREMYPDYKIAFVGSHTSALPREVLSIPSVDFVLLNEGVYALHNLLKSNLKGDLSSVEGIGWKRNKDLVLNNPAPLVPQEKMDEDLPGYAWDLLPFRNKPFDLYRAHYWHTNYSDENRTPFAAIYTSLGCKFGCSFCMINILNRTDNREDGVASDYKTMRWWSSDFILKEFKKLKDYGVTNIRISDEMFFLNKEHYQPIIEGLIKLDLGLNLWAYSRVDTCRKEWLSRFKQAGINWLALGIESGQQSVRLEITKGSFKDVNIRDIVKNIKESNINIVGNYIFGFPNERLEDLKHTLDLAIELNTEHLNVYTATVLPGSPLYLEAIKNNSKDKIKNMAYSEFSFLSYDCNPLDTKYLTGKEILKFRDEAWQLYNTNPLYLNMIENKFGKKCRENIETQAKIKLKRKLLGD